MMPTVIFSNSTIINIKFLASTFLSLSISFTYVYMLGKLGNLLFTTLLIYIAIKIATRKKTFIAVLVSPPLLSPPYERLPDTVLEIAGKTKVPISRRNTPTTPILNNTTFFLEIQNLSAGIINNSKITGI